MSLFSHSDDEIINWDDLNSDFWDVLDSRRRAFAYVQNADAGIMTDEWIQNSQKDEPPSTKTLNK